MPELSNILTTADDDSTGGRCVVSLPESVLNGPQTLHGVRLSSTLLPQKLGLDQHVQSEIIVLVRSQCRAV